jgi:hypothetical protein
MLRTRKGLSESLDKANLLPLVNLLDTLQDDPVQTCQLSRSGVSDPLLELIESVELRRRNCGDPMNQHERPELTRMLLVEVGMGNCHVQKRDDGTLELVSVTKLLKSSVWTNPPAAEFHATRSE